jgi:dolichyl-phosphate beta-glucosyltransferase
VTLRDFPHSISVVIPAYNEAARLPNTLRDVHAFLTENVKDFEILVVDDGSRDETVAMVKKIASELSNIRVIENAKNQGKGAVVRQGLKAARGEYRVFMDADHSTNINELSKLPVMSTTGAHVYVSSRYLPGSRVVISQPRQRVMVSRISNILIRMLVVPGVRDTQNGFKIFKAAVINDIAPWLTVQRWAFDVEMLYLARRFGYKIVEFPVTWHNSVDSKVDLSRDLKRTAGEFWQLLKNIVGGRYPKSAAESRQVKPGDVRPQSSTSQNPD